MRKKTALIFFTIQLTITAAIVYGTLTRGHDWGDDFAAYIMQAQKIIELDPRSFLAENFSTVENSSEPFGPVAYPWGFSVMLAPFLAVCGLNMLCLKAVGAISFFMFLVLLWLGFRRYHEPLWLLCLTGMFAFNPNMLSFLNQIMSDIPFLLFSSAGILFIGRLALERRVLISRIWDYILLGAIIAGAYCIRTNGALLLATLALVQCRDLFPHPGRRFREFISAGKGRAAKEILAVLSPYITFFCIVLPWEAAMPRMNAPSLGIGSIPKNFIANLSEYILVPADFFSGVPQCTIIYFATIPLAIAGFLRRYRSDWHIFLYCALTCGLYFSLPPFSQGLRYILPILPFYFSYVITGLELFQGGRTHGQRAFRKALCCMPVLFIFACFLASATSDARLNLLRDRQLPAGPFTPESRSMVSFIKANTPEDSTIIFFKPRFLRMMTGRKSLMIREKQNLARGNYVCLSKSHALSGGQVPAGVMEDLVLRKAAAPVFENAEFTIYKLTAGRTRS